MSDFGKWLLYLLRGNRGLAVGICAFLAASPLINGLMFVLNQHFFNGIAALSHYNTLMLLVVGLFAVRLLEVVTTRYQSYTQELLGIRMDKKLETYPFSLVEAHTLNLIETPDYQNDLHILLQNLRKTNQLVITVITQFRELLVVAVYAYLLLKYHWGVFGVVVILSFPSLVYVIKHATNFEKFFVSISQAEMEKGNLTSLLLQPPAQKEKLIFHAGPFFIRKWVKAFDKVMTEKVKFMRSELKWGLGVDVAIPAKFILIQVILLPLLYRGHLGFGDYMAITAAAVPLDNSLRTLITSFDTYKNLQIFSYRLREFKTRYGLSENEEGTAIERISSVAISDLTFRYPNQTEAALFNVNLTVRQGEVIGLIGENGSGKSTLAKVIAGLYEVPDRTVAIDHHWIEDVLRESVHRHVAIVAQDFARLPLSVFENIAVEEPNEQNLKEMQDLLDRYPELIPAALKGDLNQLIGNSYLNSKQLSGGQWQRIALARALYKNSDCLILDEATSEIDPDAEMAIMRKILADRRSHHKITIIVTHNIHLACLTDRVYVMRDGSIIEQGSPAELNASQSVFRHVVHVQEQAKEELSPRESEAFI